MIYPLLKVGILKSPLLYCCLCSQNKGSKDHAQITKESKSAAFNGPPSLEEERQVHNNRCRKQGAAAISAPETTPPAKLSGPPVTNQVFLGSWMVHICQEYYSLRPAWRRKCTAHLGLCPRSTPGTRRSLVLRSAHCLGLWQLSFGPPTVSIPHTSKLCLFALSLSTAQLSK